MTLIPLACSDSPAYRPRCQGNPPEKFLPVYKKARELGIENLTGHVGEEGTADNVWMFVEGFDMGINRLDHGIVSADDPSLLDLLAKRKTLVTVCPLSNVRLRCVKEVKEVPLLKFIEHGVRFSLNSDDPAYAHPFTPAPQCAT